MQVGENRLSDKNLGLERHVEFRPPMFVIRNFSVWCGGTMTETRNYDYCCRRGPYTAGSLAGKFMPRFITPQLSGIATPDILIAHAAM